MFLDLDQTFIVDGVFTCGNVDGHLAKAPQQLLSAA